LTNEIISARSFTALPGVHASRFLAFPSYTVAKAATMFSACWGEKVWADDKEAQTGAAEDSNLA
jgi:hypothetical protein